MDPDSLLSGENAAYLEALQEQYQRDPSSVDPVVQDFFRSYNGVSARAPAPDTRSIFHARGGGGTDLAAADRQAKVARLINAYRVHGHVYADLDPLHSRKEAPQPELDPAFYGLNEADLDQVVATSPTYGIPPHATLRELLAHLRRAYCGRVGVEYMNVRQLDQKRWLQERFETRVHNPGLQRSEQVRILEMLTRADGFERFLGAKFTGNKRFSLEGAESVIPLLDRVITEGARRGVREVVIGMAHRGRLNVLLNILGKPPGAMLAEFADPGAKAKGKGSGDVKYHLGYSSEYTTVDGQKVHMSLAFNPSHLEAVNPVVEGRVRAKQDRVNDRGGAALPLLIHGDAAFIGQGIVAEVFNLAELEGYATGGTVHLVINNQVGFTTSPKDSRSTPYCTDLARMLGIPIFHINGEDPEEVATIVGIALEWRQTFQRDVVIDMYAFRKHGHNETDEPAFTQPLMYRQIAAHPGVREMYLRSLEARSILTRQEADAMMEAFHQRLDDALKGVGTQPQREDSAFQGLWASYHSDAPDQVVTAVPVDRLSSLLLSLNDLPEGFTPHPKIQRLFKLREEQAAGKKPLDWAAGELLAYATLVQEGHPVRLSGQDCKRGTFSHRHAVLFDYQNGKEHCALDQISDTRFRVYNSSLSEAGVLGFEYGYSLDYPDALVIWEAQFGDFVNGAQIIIDNFLVSGEAKWNRSSGLTLFLPHGYEGQGPEHSSARMERFLQACAEDNIQCVNCTTPAQIFHLLRRQVLRKVRDPLIVFTPKSLLRSPEAVSTLSELAEGQFQELIGDPRRGAKRVVLCSGKVYYDLLAARGDADVAILRLEQLYPLPLEALQAELALHPGAELIWCQEEPKNMGAWSYIALALLEAGISLRYAGRVASASPATGYPKRHALEQKSLVDAALGR
jgi:2-oxoglutarate dehydrogenase E1 component